MKAFVRHLGLVLLALTVSATAVLGQVTTAGSGNWSSTATWTGGVLPTSTDDVVISTGDTVILDVDSVAVKSIVVGADSSAGLFFDATKNTTLVVSGSIMVSPQSAFKVQSRVAPATVDLIHRVFLYGSLTHQGKVLDFRSGSTNSNAAVANFELVGPDITVLAVLTPFTTTNGEFNAIHVNKSGSGTVILGSDIYLAGGSSSNPNTFPWLNLESGLVFTGDFAIIHRYASNNGSVTGGSEASYVVGAMGRGMGNSGGATRTFPVGDLTGYRPFTVRSTTGGSSTGHHIIVRANTGDANTGSSTLSPAIDKVSTVRYYKVNYMQGPGAATMDVDRLTVSYGIDDGVGQGNIDLRVAVSTDDRATWTALGQLVNDTTFSPDAAIQDSMAALTMASATTNLYVSLARISGTTTNSLDFTSAVEQVDPNPSSWSLGQNYPNPFNPETNIEFSLPKRTDVTVTILNLLGQRVASLVQGSFPAGTQVVRWNGRDASGRIVPSGVYFYRLDTPEFSQTRRMILMK